MRHLLVIAAVVSIFWALHSVVHSRGGDSQMGFTGFLLGMYCGFHAGFIASSYLATLFVPIESPDYAWAYRIGSIGPMFFASALALRWSFGHGSIPGALSFVGLVACGGMVASVLERDVITAFHLQFVSEVIHWHFATAVVFTACGIAAFLSLAIQSGGVEEATKLALSIFWTVFGVYMFAYSIGRMNPYVGWFVRASWIPTVAAFVAFSWLAWTLSNQQRELSHQPLPAVTAREYAYVPEVQE